MITRKSGGEEEDDEEDNELPFLDLFEEHDYVEKKLHCDNHGEDDVCELMIAIFSGFSVIHFII
jgi:hypothetical protein